MKIPDFSFNGLIGFFKRHLSHDKLRLFANEHLPNRKDNVIQITAKVAFIGLIIGSVISTSCFFDYFSDIKRDQKAISGWTDIWNSDLNDIDKVRDRSKAEIFKLLEDKNEDFEAWIKIGSTSISAPVFKSEDNNYYKNHNCDKKRSSNGALYFDSSVSFSSNKQSFNTVIYGNNIPDGSLFGCLERFRETAYLTRNHSIVLYHPQKTSTYKIFACFVYDPEDDFKLFDTLVVSDQDFNDWIEEIYARSFITTEIPINREDRFLTLITDCSDYPGAKTVVMARKVRSGETTYVSSSEIFPNARPQTPKK